jgi:hypothetical protein
MPDIPPEMTCLNWTITYTCNYDNGVIFCDYVISYGFGLRLSVLQSFLSSHFCVRDNSGTTKLHIVSNVFNHGQIMCILKLYSLSSFKMCFDDGGKSL